MKAKKTAILSLTILLLTTNIHSQQIQEKYPKLPFMLNTEEKKQLEQTGQFTKYFDNTPIIIYTGEYYKEIQQQINKLKPTIGVETIFIIPMTEKLRAEKNTQLAIYNITHKISSMSGIEYYSASRKKMRIMFKEAYIIDNQKNKNKQPDPEYNKIPQTDSILIYQDDSSFGKNIYSIDYIQKNTTLILSMINRDKLAYMGWIPLVDPGNISINLIIIPREEYIIFYGICSVKTISFFGIEKRYDSFYNRIVALKNWFTTQIQ
ncbi:DUF6675 family protein [Spirochaetia bacterium 38H-sp]|uniref:DUF6675 family protein n=1 Tax=Rarispira pelagica TaxID=3141764 RepID=A0ABU9UFS3_9SPIR